MDLSLLYAAYNLYIALYGPSWRPIRLLCCGGWGVLPCNHTGQSVTSDPIAPGWGGKGQYRAGG